jgi:FKBP-type peptidyl-prolyl cis-trans isomerase
MRNLLLATILIVAISACDNQAGKSSSGQVSTEADTVALSLGYSLGKNISSQFGDVDPQLIMKGFIDAFEGNKNPLFANEQEVDMAIRAYMKKESDKKAQVNLEEGQAFLAENAKKKDVQVTESGLQYIVLEEGNGEKPTAESTVKVDYHGTTIDGTVFDSSVERGEPVEFPLNGVIPGWTEGVQLMNVGSKYKFFIPSDLAYGPRGAGGQIGPNAALIFEVELLEIIK